MSPARREGHSISAATVNGDFVTHDGLKLAYRTVGVGRPVVLLHALTANSALNWEAPGITDAIVSRGWQAVMLDARGHGGSDRPTDPPSYVWDRHGGDVVALLDHLGLEECVLVGYSLGGGTAAWVTPIEPRVRGAVLAGICAESIDVPQERADEMLSQFARMSTGDDAADLASGVAVATATVRALLEPATFRLADIDVPVLVLNGADDFSPEEIGSQIPGARTRIVPGGHDTAPLSPDFATAVVDFLDDLVRPG